MKHSMFKILIAATALSMVVPAAIASKAPKCPACKMTLSSKKDKVHTVAVKIGKKTLYCCAGCKMNHPKPTHKMRAKKAK